MCCFQTSVPSSLSVRSKLGLDTVFFTGCVGIIRITKYELQLNCK